MANDWVEGLNAIKGAVRTVPGHLTLVRQGMPRYRPDSHFVGSTSASAFTPTDLSGLVAWYDASQIEGLSSDQSVSSWADESGNGNTLTQGTAARQPVYKTGILNSLPVVRFDGSDDRVSTAASDVLPQVSTVFVVYANRTGTNGTLFTSVGGAAQMPLQRNTQSWPDANVAAMAMSQNLNDNNLWTSQYDYTGDVFSVRLDGAAVASDSATARVLADSKLLLGANLVFSEFLNGDIAEVIIYDSTLNGTQVSQVESYCATKYNITLG